MLLISKIQLEGEGLWLGFSAISRCGGGRLIALLVHSITKRPPTMRWIAFRSRHPDCQIHLPLVTKRGFHILTNVFCHVGPDARP